MATLIQELEERDGAVEYKKNSFGPSARTLGTFLKKSGKMGGGDSPSYYWGYVLCEKLRMWEGGKKTRTREENETGPQFNEVLNDFSYAGGLEREDPSHMWVWAHQGERPVWQPVGRQASMPNGYERWNPSTERFICHVGGPRPNLSALSEKERGMPCLKFQVMSDLRLEVGQQYQSFNIPAKAPFLVLAGNVGNLTHYDLYLAFLKIQCTNFERILLVLGSHEFFGTSRQEGIRLAKNLAAEEILEGKLSVLHRERVDMDCVTILDCTLNSHIAPKDFDAVAASTEEFSEIENWTVQDHNQEHKFDIEWLIEEINKIHANKDAKKRRIIVITHHAPIMKMVYKSRSVENPCSSAFATDILESMNYPTLSSVAWWIFGRAHHRCQVSQGGVNVMSNPRGYATLAAWDVEKLQRGPWQKVRHRSKTKSTEAKETFDVRKVIEVGLEPTRGVGTLNRLTGPLNPLYI
ncbi:MAG: hypothetical protein Q9214_001060 [Letrouitia sp. 1 TL-2023]